MLATGMCFIPAKQLGVRWQDLLKFIDMWQGRPSQWRTGRGPSPSASARAAESHSHSGIGEPRGAGLKREDSRGSIPGGRVLTYSQTTQWESVNEWPAGLTHEDFSPLHMGPLTSSHVGMVVFTRWTRLQLVPVGNSGLPLRPDFLS